MKIAERVTVVTGGASGIGRALCLAFAQQGAAAVVVADIDAQGAGEVAAAIEATGHRAIAVTADMTREADVQALVARAEDVVRAHRPAVLKRGHHRARRCGGR